MANRVTGNQNTIWLPITKIWNIRAKWASIRMYNKILKICFKVNNFALEIFLIFEKMSICGSYALWTKLGIFDIPNLEHWIFWLILCYFVCQLKVYYKWRKQWLFLSPGHNKSFESLMFMTYSCTISLLTWIIYFFFLV